MDQLAPSASFKLENQVAVVTGGARGIGAGIVRRFVQEGARVVFSDLLNEPLAESDQLFLPVDIFPPQHLVLGVFSDQFTSAEAAKPAIARKGISSGNSSSAVAKSCLNFAGSRISGTVYATSGRSMSSKGLRTSARCSLP
jgi:NAD(P)-dependent dehydrogenase (short-subunit alcohol dehydrogenase family)